LDLPLHYTPVLKKILRLHYHRLQARTIVPQVTHAAVSLLIFLPTFDVPTQQLGEQSCNLLFNLIAGEKGLQNITIGTQILLTDFLI